MRAFFLRAAVSFSSALVSAWRVSSAVSSSVVDAVAMEEVSGV